MDISEIGRWIILGLGVIFLLAALVLIVKDWQRRWGPLSLLIFGTLFLGLGVFGPGFLKDYSEFIKSFSTLADMEKSASPDTYRAAFTKVGQGELSGKYQELALAYALDRPVKNMDTLLGDAIGKASDPAGKQALERARAELAGKQFAAEQIAAYWEASKRATKGELQKLDSSTRTFVAQQLLPKANDKSKEIPVAPHELENMSQPRSPRAKLPN